MRITSYAQNFEDVMLWRALSHIEEGFYVDIGAQDPIIDSVSLAFFEHGWRGIDIEPMSQYAELLRSQRPGNAVIQAAVGNSVGVIRFFEIPGTGISTADAFIAQRHKASGHTVNEITVPCVTLCAVLESITSTEIHWLKIDVEGSELQVLSSWEPSVKRPWIVIVESTLPLTQIETYQTWEPILLSLGYSMAYFDGLNRFYVSNGHPELLTHFKVPPNVFDDFVLNGTANASFHRLLQERHQQELTQIGAARAASAATYEANISLLKSRLCEAESTKAQREQEFAEHKRDADNQLYKISEQATIRERELGNQLQISSLKIVELSEYTKLLTDQMLSRLEQKAMELAELQVRHNKANEDIRSLLSSASMRESELWRELSTAERDFFRRYADCVRERDLKDMLLSEANSRERALNELLNEARIQLTTCLERQASTAEALSSLSMRTENELESLRNSHRVQLEAKSRELSSAYAVLARWEADLKRSMSWRITAPLRWLTPSAPRTVEIDLASASNTQSAANIQSEANSSPVNAHNNFVKGAQTSMADTPSGTVMEVTPSVSLKRLLALKGGEFVDSAYLTILNRMPDDDGRAHYINRLTSGHGKMEILSALYKSDEARTSNVQIPWLRRAVLLHSFTKLPIVRLFRRRSSVRERMLEFELELNRLNRRVASLADESSKQAQDFAKLAGSVFDYLRSPASVQESEISPKSEAVMSGKSLVAKRIYRALAEAIAEQSSE